MKRAFAYLGKKSRRKYESGIDKLTIDRGLGWQLHDFSDFVLNISDATAKYKKAKRKTYLVPEQIKELIIMKPYAISQR